MLRRTSSAVLIALATLSPLLAASNAGGDPPARPPVLDPTFGGTGYVHAGYGRDWIGLSTIAEMPDGKVVVGGDTSAHGGGSLVVFRYLADGTPDLSFNGTGRVSWAPCRCSAFSGGIAGVRREADGSLLLVGFANPHREPGRYYSREDIVLLRPSLGDAGIERIDLGGRESVAAALFPPAEDAVLVAGARDGRLLVAKVRARGAALDTTFAAPRGWVAPNVGGSESAAQAMALDAEGRVLVAGWVEEKGDRDVLVARLLPSGALDEGFGAGGVLRFARPGAQEARAIAVLPDGRVLVGGATEDPGARRFLLLRLLPGGGLDPSFGAGGVALAPLGHAQPDYRLPEVSMVVMKDGRIVAGSSDIQNEDTRPALARFQPDGALDPTFGEGGLATFAVKKGPGWVPSSKSGGSEETRLGALALTRDGKLLASGQWSAYAYQGFLARLSL